MAQINDKLSLRPAVAGRWDAKAFFVLLIIFIATQSSAQQSSEQAYDLPVVLSRVNTRTYVSQYDPYDPSNPYASVLERTHYSAQQERVLVQDFSVDNFQVRVGGMPGDLQSVSVDKGPKRISLTLDASSRISKQQWGAELTAAGIILGNARSVDRFAFVLVGASPGTSGFVSPDEAKKHLKSLRNTRPATAGPEAAIYDALLTAAKTLDPPQFGDTIIFFGLGQDSGSRSTAADLRHLFLERRVRFYGLAFPTSPVQKLDDVLRLLPDPELASLTDATGCDFWVNGLSGGYDVFYKSIAEPYRLRVVSSTASEASLQITLLSGQKRKSIIDVTIKYPRFITP